MTTLVRDVDVERELIAERRRWGHDRFDEVWDGTYVMNPLPNIEHQEIQARFTYALEDAIGIRGLGMVFAGVNVSDRQSGWKKNYRCPDVVVFLNETHAVNCNTHWCGGPDFAVEIVTANDRSRDKLEFYGQVGRRELLLIDRKPWSLELF